VYVCIFHRVSAQVAKPRGDFLFLVSRPLAIFVKFVQSWWEKVE